MTELYIDGQLAALPEGFNITFTSENPYFTRSSNYSLDIELPMPANHAIFKHVNRLDVTKKRLSFRPRSSLMPDACFMAVQFYCQSKMHWLKYSSYRVMRNLIC